MSAQDLHDSITKELGAFVRSRSATFTCGGTVPITSPGKDDPNLINVVLRWDSKDSSNGIAKLEFSVTTSNDSQKALLKLIGDCQPASFGYKGEDVFDESYSKAFKMDRSALSVDFCPYELGIVDTIAQLLLPNAGGKRRRGGIKAKLYKLNIYSSPSDLFKAHVDTPCPDTQFGSLVVSLPCHHEGGQLVIRHDRHSSSVQWAAFYSDCEHEVKEVTKGHRITLTYNLCFAPGVGDVACKNPTLNSKSLPLYRKIKEALAEPSFMKDGGYLGVMCYHAYAHSTVEGYRKFPSVLKGSEMAVYSIFESLGLDVQVRPVLALNKQACRALEDKPPGNLIGRKMQKLIINKQSVYDEHMMEFLLDKFDGEWLEVNWLTDRRQRNVGLVYCAWGNEYSVEYMYTYAALIVCVQAAEKRVGHQ
ncbi:hypothetical protein BS50DRAFT_608305 [Corynespora cassiicola Philippines]|uniref:Fe2OG dioxygenase domain-containing protein n=1 Tax=Corynespora cassiicola Philippines TaxID=1448308 RepID=A0A2T2P179_CORCC|nr:hypothetical protein BS50DRAFT_608305 [Corynespora cassiicola Philippines]